MTDRQRRQTNFCWHGHPRPWAYIPHIYPEKGLVEKRATPLAAEGRSPKGASRDSFQPDPFPGYIIPLFPEQQRRHLIQRPSPGLELMGCALRHISHSIVSGCLEVFNRLEDHIRILLRATAQEYQLHLIR